MFCRISKSLVPLEPPEAISIGSTGENAIENNPRSAILITGAEWEKVNLLFVLKWLVESGNYTSDTCADVKQADDAVVTTGRGEDLTVGVRL